MGNFTNVRDLVVAFLNEIGHERVYRRAPSNLPHILPAFVVTRFGGGDDLVVRDVANIDIDTFAATEDIAEDIAEDIRTAMRIRLPKRNWNGMTVLTVRTISAPVLLPWDASSVYRVGASYQVTAHQYSGVS